VWLKVLLALGCGAVIGLERELSDKPAGLRTTMLICIGSTLITMVSISLALTYGASGHVADPGRIAAGIVSGIGFLGAGTIIQARGDVHGLTTAATIWAMAGVGMAIGAGFFGAAMVSTAILLVVLVVLGWLERRFTPHREYAFYRVHARPSAGVLEALDRLAQRIDVHLHPIEVKRRDEAIEVRFSLGTTHAKRDELVQGLLGIEAIDDVQIES